MNTYLLSNTNIDSLKYYLDEEISLLGSCHYGNYLIDLTGRTPGLNIISGAKFVSHPWWTSAYIGSEPLAEKIISLSNIDKIKNSWIITTNHKFNISPEILNNIGLSLDKNFKFVGKVKRNNKYYFIWKPNKL